jgi:hypothetical protein
MYLCIYSLSEQGSGSVAGKYVCVESISKGKYVCVESISAVAGG